MKFLLKIEDAINHVLILIGDLFMNLLKKLMHPKLILLIERIKQAIAEGILWLKNLPKLIIQKTPIFISWFKNYLKTFNYKTELEKTFAVAIAQYEKTQAGHKLSKLKQILLVPFLIVGQWLQGLTAAQTVILLGSTAASVLAAINIFFSSHRVLESHQYGYRSPASMEFEEEEVVYERPDYYKQEFRHLQLTNVRLPVYVTDINELKHIDIDFTATLSNRMGRMMMERLEFQLRDHLILEVEPMEVNSPLVDEGKEILRQKLMQEINTFLKSRQIEGYVQDLKLTYILGN
jgi:flagellar basal body-associated protein FliL